MVTPSPLPTTLGSDARPLWPVYLAWSTTALFFGYGFMLRVAPSVMVEEMMRDFSVGGALVGSLSAFYFYAYAPLQIPVGVLMDRIGPRRLTSLAAATAGLGAILFAASDGLVLAALGRLLIGAGAAFSWVGCLVAAGRLLPASRFAMLVGIGQLVGMAGGVLGQAPLGASVGAFGWRATSIGLGIAGLALGLVLYAVLRDHPKGRAAPPAPTVSPGSLLRGLAIVTSNPQTWLNALIGMALTGPMLAFGGLWAVPYFGTVYGLERPAAAGLTSLIFAVWGLGAPTVGWIADRLGQRRIVLQGGALLCTASLVALLHWPGLPLAVAVALACLSGLGGSTMILTFAGARDSNRPEHSGAAFGLVNTAVTGSGAILQPLVGYLLDLGWDGTLVGGARVYAPATFSLALSVLPAISFAGLLATLALRETGAFAARRPAS